MMRHAGQHPDRLGEVAERLSPKQTLATKSTGALFPERTAPEPPLPRHAPLKYINTHDQLADLLTKSLGPKQHAKLKTLMTGL